MKQIIIYLILATVLLTSCNSAKWIEGDWEGEGKQFDGQEWHVSLSVDKHKKVEIAYPSLSCSGIWNEVSRKKNHITYTEEIKKGTNNCDQGVEVQVDKINDSIVEVSYYIRKVKPLQPIATARLTKKKK